VVLAQCGERAHEAREELDRRVERLHRLLARAGVALHQPQVGPHLPLPNQQAEDRQHLRQDGSYLKRPRFDATTRLVHGIQR
jgi:hypothetical protein